MRNAKGLEPKSKKLNKKKLAYNFLQESARLQEDPVELLNRLATVLCEVLDDEDSSQSECLEIEESETTQCDVAEQQDAKPESTFERFRRSLRRLSSNTIHQVSMQSEIQDRSYDQNVSPSNSAKRQFISSKSRRLSELSHPTVSLVNSDLGDERSSVKQQSIERPFKKRPQRSLSECHSSAVNGEQPHGFFELASNRSPLTIPRTIRRNCDETDADMSVPPMSIEEFCVILDQVHLSSNNDLQNT